MIKLDMESLKRDGYTERFAQRIIRRMAEDNGIFSPEKIEEAHEKGFCALSVDHYAGWGKNLDEYLRDYDYDKLWPLNGWTRIWVNDKLTLKYMLADTSLNDVMPDYYYYVSEDGIRSLIDNEDKTQTIDAFLETLKMKKTFACKPSNGRASEGFFKLEYKDEYFINDEKCSENTIIEFVENHPNYLYTEYLLPEKTLAKINDKIHTIRVMVINKDGNNPYIVPSSYVRFGTDAQGASNYVTKDNNADYSIFAGVDTETGKFGDARAFYADRVEGIDFHPDSGERIEGVIPNWNLLCEKILEISKRFFGIEWMGFDICVDLNGRVRIMEINTHPGITYAQVFKPLLSDLYVKNYFEDKLRVINQMDGRQIEERNKIVR